MVWMAYIVNGLYSYDLYSHGLRVYMTHEGVVMGFLVMSQMVSKIHDHIVAPEASTLDARIVAAPTPTPDPSDSAPTLLIFSWQ